MVTSSWDALHGMWAPASYPYEIPHSYVVRIITYVYNHIYIYIIYIYTGWWFQPTPLKNMSSSVEILIPNRME